uniref:Uncharacterized protein n=1 Tax=Glossina austeni TaxID=7395 RepID=A0A1A9UDL8_GLOAU
MDFMTVSVQTVTFRRNSTCPYAKQVVPARQRLIVAIILSKVGIQLSDKWQFAKKTQLPSRIPSIIIFVATGAWPWPKLNENIREDIFVCSAKVRRDCVGSTPGDNTNISGV